MKDRIKLIRKNENKTQQEFADKLNIPRNNIACYETGKNNPSDAVISLICEKCSINEEWLRNGTGEMYVELSKNEYIAEFVGRVMKDRDDSFKKKYIEMLSKLDERGWEALEQVALAMGQLKKD